MSLSIDEIHKLLSITELSHKWPPLKAIHDAAMRALGTHAEVAKKDNDEAKAKAEAEAAKAKAEADAKAKAAADKAEAAAEERNRRADPTGPLTRRSVPDEED